LTDILFGDVNPSGKLPCTFPKALADTPTAKAGARAYPGVDGTAHYDEGLLVGYRWYDAKKIEPLFPFGFGLSYTTFTYSNLRVSSTGPASALVECDITNSGSRAGAEVAQLYVQPGHPAVERPEQELKGFVKVALAPGETKTVRIGLNARSFAYYEAEKHVWAVDAGDYGILVGSSSRDIRLHATHSIAAASSAGAMAPGAGTEAGSVACVPAR
jgi:beta-glucosidase